MKNWVYSAISLFEIEEINDYRNIKYWYEKYNTLVENDLKYIILNLNKFNINEFYNEIDKWDINTKIDDLRFNNKELFTTENKLFYSKFPKVICKYEAKRLCNLFKQLYFKNDNIINIINNSKYIIEITKNNINKIISLILILKLI
ncbi:hypothetical protein PIROE2DRAFT_17506 [Piromyces sp. E2]|nr:hypothetical protein PIROE2DRAFT_17506 [Piromyces sp. E2]|eukprot:OUM57498.1 hypothetical protein PIROE2DRAFT_17506 [Piromyces sp. E2]